MPERRTAPRRRETIDHPAHYGGADNTYEAIKVIDAWALGFCLGNTVKYIARAGRKPGASALEDLKKAAWYLAHEIKNIEEEQKLRAYIEHQLAKETKRKRK